MTSAQLTISGLRVRAADAPMERAVQTAAGPVRSAPIVLVDLHTNEGVSGSAYVFTYTRTALAATAKLICQIEPLLVGQGLAPLNLNRHLASQFRLLGTQGLVGIALSAIDMAAWDAYARALGCSLAQVLGATGEEKVSAYASLRGWTAGELAAEAERALTEGFRAVKIKIGHKKFKDELEVVRAVRQTVGDDVRLMVDYNQELLVAEGIQRADALEPYDITWIEEPLRADDYEGHALVARSARIPVQLGENCWGPYEVAKSLAARASDFIMLDVMKIGGVTGWQKAIALAGAAGCLVSSHLFIEFSSQLLAATPARHYLEWLDLARPLLKSGSPSLIDGNAIPYRGPGSGLEWDEEAVKRYEL